MWFRHLLFDLFGMYEDEFQYWAIDEANKRMADTQSLLNL